MKQNKTQFKVNTKEKILLILTLIFLIALIVKSLYFDPYEPKATDQIEKVDQYISETYDNFMYDLGIINVRLVDYNETESGAIQMHMRKYVLYIFPFGDAYGEVK